MLPPQAIPFHSSWSRNTGAIHPKLPLFYLLWLSSNLLQTSLPTSHRSAPLAAPQRRAVAGGGGTGIAANGQRRFKWRLWRNGGARWHGCYERDGMSQVRRAIHVRGHKADVLSLMVHGQYFTGFPAVVTPQRTKWATMHLADAPPRAAAASSLL